jgi:hypothetical protein
MDPLRLHVIALLKGGQAYDTFDDVVNEFAPEQRGIIPPGAEHSPWQIVEHMRIALRDILDFSQNEKGDYKHLDWPEGYWPKEALGDWEETIRSYRADMEEMERLVNDPERNLFQPFPWGDGQTLLREALLAADHAGYHLGQLVELKRWISTLKL